MDAAADTFMEVHVLLEAVFGGQSFGADGADEGLLPGVFALVNQQSVFLGEPLSTDRAAERLFSCVKQSEDGLGTRGIFSPSSMRPDSCCRPLLASRNTTIFTHRPYPEENKGHKCEQGAEVKAHH